MTNSPPFFSIVVPTFNRAPLLQKTLETLLSQDCQSFEVLIIDDGSTDNTQQVVECIQDNRLSYYKVSNRERGAARNYGATQATGKYINFFDSDDLAYSWHLETAQAVLDENNTPELFALSYQIVDSKERILKDIILKKDVSLFIATGNHLSCNGVFLKKELALANPFNEDRLLSGSEDYELWLRLASKYLFPCFPNTSHAVVQHDARSTSSFKPEPLITRKHLMLKYAFEDANVRKKFGAHKDRIHSSAFSYIALHLALTGGEKKEAMLWWKKSIQLDPVTILSKRTLAILKHILIS